MKFLRRTTEAGVVTLGAGTLTATTLGSQAAVAAKRRAGPLRVDIVMFDGVEELDCVAPYEAFSIAGVHSWHGGKVRYVTTGRPRPIRAAFGTLIQVNHRWAPEEADLIVVPGGGAYTRREGPGIWDEIHSGVFPPPHAEG